MKKRGTLLGRIPPSRWHSFRRASTAVTWDKDTFVADVSIGHSVHSIGEYGRFFYSRAKDCARCPLRSDCLSKGRANKAVVVGDDYPALLRARRRRERWSAEDRRLYQRHRWRSEGFHGEAKSWHGLARAIRRGLSNMKIQAYLTAAVVNLKRLAATFYAFISVSIAFRACAWPHRATSCPRMLTMRKLRSIAG